MKSLYLFLALILAVPTAVDAQNNGIPFFMTNAASSFNIDVTLMYAICMQESKCRAGAINHNDGTKLQKNRGVVSKSHGMFQIKLATAKALGFTGTTKDLRKSDINAYYAAKLLRSLYNKYKDTIKVISAYNAGKPITSNKNYTRRVVEYYVRLKIDKPLN
jgi:soluble lytic murein transglycosylase-like protein